jgi:hypothetical protein
MPQSPSSDDVATGADTHLRAVQDHIAFGDALKATGRADATTVGWAITALFYAALHAVRAYLKACKQVDVASHGDFKGYERQFPELRRTALDYNHLKQESQSARYYCNPNFTWDNFDDLRRKAERVANVWVPKATSCITGAADPRQRPTA